MSLGYLRGQFARLVVAWLACSVYVIFAAEFVTACQLVQEPITSKRYQRYVKGLMNKADLNQDGFIDKSEKEILPGPLLAKADSDGDGLISAKEILEKILIDQKSRSSGHKADFTEEKGSVDAELSKDDTNESSPQSVKISAIVLKLPDKFAKSQLLSLEDMHKKLITGKEPENDEIKTLGLDLLDQFEMEATLNNACKIQFGTQVVYREWVSNRNDGSSLRQNSQLDVGSSFVATPRVKDGALTLNVHYAGTYLLPDPLDSDVENLELIQLDIENTFVLQEKKTTAVNLFSHGSHFLLLLSIN